MIILSKVIPCSLEVISPIILIGILSLDNFTISFAFTASRITNRVPEEITRKGSTSSKILLI